MVKDLEPIGLHFLKTKHIIMERNLKYRGYSIFTKITDSIIEMKGLTYKIRTSIKRDELGASNIPDFFQESYSFLEGLARVCKIHATGAKRLIDRELDMTFSKDDFKDLLGMGFEYN